MRYIFCDVERKHFPADSDEGKAVLERQRIASKTLPTYQFSSSPQLIHQLDYNLPNTRHPSCIHSHRLVFESLFTGKPSCYCGPDSIIFSTSTHAAHYSLRNNLVLPLTPSFVDTTFSPFFSSLSLLTTENTIHLSNFSNPRFLPLPLFKKSLLHLYNGPSLLTCNRSHCQYFHSLSNTNFSKFSLPPRSVPTDMVFITSNCFALLNRDGKLLLNDLRTQKFEQTLIPQQSKLSGGRSLSITHFPFLVVSGLGVLLISLISVQLPLSTVDLPFLLTS
ncbi:hypothetical protein GEMRC1_005480 [Eukaryota sp. GEM-RC1]